MSIPRSSASPPPFATSPPPIPTSDEEDSDSRIQRGHGVRHAQTWSQANPSSTSRRRRNRPGPTVTGHDVGVHSNPISAARRSSVYLRDNLSDVSLESATLLDHRNQSSMKPRRSSTVNFGTSSYSHALSGDGGRRQLGSRASGYDGGEDGESSGDERSPLLRPERHTNTPGRSRHGKQSRPSTAESAAELRTSVTLAPIYGSVNFPPSVPGSPRGGPTEPSGTIGNGNDYTMGPRRDGDTVITIEDDGPFLYSNAPELQNEGGAPGIRTSTFLAEEDVCFPVDDGLIDEDMDAVHGGGRRNGRRRFREWPDFGVLEEWSREEKEERSEGIRAKKLPEPVYVGGRLRPPQRQQWHRDEDDAPYRFTYFNEDLPATIHSHTISELLQPGQTFRHLFKPDPVVSDESSSSEDETDTPPLIGQRIGSVPGNGMASRKESSITEAAKPVPRLGQRPTFWLDVYSPTDTEMKVLSKAFGIHPLTAEDIMMQEAREKVELFRSYYLVSYRTFEHDSRSENFMEPVNIYFVVFREGLISFHFSMTPHPANVRRRIRQLKDYINVSADWISYALIDDITDAFAPLIQSLEKEVDDIDDAILRMHLGTEEEKKGAADGEGSDGDMLKRVGDSRRNAMGLFRLMGNKADVIKGFAKRCNEQWEVAPRSEIGLYLGDIQDHIVTMVSNLNHMEKILSRAHSNYLAQINIKMNERQEKTADVLGRLTVLGTIVLPMNIITGLWGMNVMVPGQTIENLDWFWCITAGLILFGFICYSVAKRVYGIV